MARRQYVELKDLEDWCFEQIVCADYPRKLTIHVTPITNATFFKLYLKDEVVLRVYTLKEALIEYNDL